MSSFFQSFECRSVKQQSSTRSSTGRITQNIDCLTSYRLNTGLSEKVHKNIFTEPKSKLKSCKFAIKFNGDC